MSGISNTQGPESISLIVFSFIIFSYIDISPVSSEWYQQYARAGQILSTQPHMVMWSVDTLPQLFEVIIFADFFFHNNIFYINTSPYMVKISVDRQLDTAIWPGTIV